MIDSVLGALKRSGKGLLKTGLTRNQLEDRAAVRKSQSGHEGRIKRQMAVHKIKKGLDLPIAGEPEQTIDDARQPSRVALIAADYHGMKPTMQVQVGDTVRRGQLLFDDKKTPGVRYTAIAGGKVAAVNRGARRALVSVVIELDEDERAGKNPSVSFSTHTGKPPAELSGDQVKELLHESGLWTALRGRPFGRVADPAKRPSSIFVTAMDSHPLAPDVATVLRGNEDHFQRGLQALTQLTDGQVYVCTSPGASLPTGGESRVQVEEFSGPHPAGTVGVHIHRLDPVDRNKLVWYAGCQDVVAIGKLFLTGELDVTRIVSLAGPSVERPRLMRTRIGASTDELVAGETSGEDLRLISGSVLSGRVAQGESEGFLGRYDQQLSVLARRARARVPGLAGSGYGQVFHHPHFPLRVPATQETGFQYQHQRLGPGHRADRALRASVSPGHHAVVSAARLGGRRSGTSGGSRCPRAR